MPSSEGVAPMRPSTLATLPGGSPPPQARGSAFAAPSSPSQRAMARQQDRAQPGRNRRRKRA
eukprot:10633329-Alexandrium_andersonii.AAC.1